MKSRPLVFDWMPVVVWMLVIFLASTDLGSAEHTSRFLVPFLHWLDPDISWRTIMLVQFGIRKLAHLTEYAVLAMLLFRAICAHVRSAFWRQASLVLLVAGLYAVTDEFHQTFTPSRTPSLHDVVIDCCGAAIGLAIYWCLTRRATTAVVARTTR